MNKENNDYLMHYGVLGMKWGIRRAAKRGETYQYTSSRTKRLDKRTARLNAKAASATNAKKQRYYSSLAKKNNAQANKSKAADKKLQNYAKKTSVGKAMAQKALFGLNDKHYASLRSQGVKRGRAVADTIIRGYTGAAGYSLLTAAGKTAKSANATFKAGTRAMANSRKRKKAAA